MKTKVLNPYTITLAVLTPVTNKVTKKDLTVLFREGVFSYSTRVNHNQVFAHFPSKEKAENILKSIKGLSKNYEVVFITDKQFGNSKWNDDLRMVATKKQIQNRFFI